MDLPKGLTRKDLNRRDFLKQVGYAAGGVAAVLASPGQIVAADRTGVALVCDPADATAGAPASQWAVGQVKQAFESKGVTVRTCRSVDEIHPEEPCVVCAGAGSDAARAVMQFSQVSMPEGPEALALMPGNLGGRAVLLAAGSDARGLSYALTEIADRVRYGDRPYETLDIREAVIERPANTIRSVMRVFASDVTDKGWFQDRKFWPRYLDMLASQRFNRFNLAFGIGYDFTRELIDTYLYFPYPFLLTVPGYNVRATGLPNAERDLNLRMLKFISDEAAARGLHFQLGLWTHAYQWTDSPDVNYVIEGLTPEQHGPYCRDALQKILETCPSIRGVTFRIHGESGVAEGSYGFWKTVFDGIVRTGRRIEIDMHAKGMTQGMIDVALATGMPVTLSPKFWAEHMGLPYHQASIRDFERPKGEATGLMAFSAGSRSFLRYGYGDLLAGDRQYGLLHRIWPGTQRVLLWGDPAYAAAYSRAFSFCGSVGVEIFEPLSFKGRKGSGLVTGRDGYADSTLKCAEGDWEKYLYTYRLWGRLTYNPNTDPEVWRRQLRKDYGPAAEPVEAAMAKASRILPLVTTVHDPSAANNCYWPEMYQNMSILDESKPYPYWDCPDPKRFGTVSPLDPQLFATVEAFAEELIRGTKSLKYSPVEVARQLEIWFEKVSHLLAKARDRIRNPRDPAYVRMEVDTTIVSGLGLFFAWKLRSAVLYALFEQSGQDAILQEALKAYRLARQAWADLAGKAKGIYVQDVTYGLEPQLRGHWSDRLAAIDKDITDMEGRAGQMPVTNLDSQVVNKIVASVLSPPRRAQVKIVHSPPTSFRPGQDLDIHVRSAGGNVNSIVLWYRRVNQADIFKKKDMLKGTDGYHAIIEGAYTDSVFPMQYYFELRPTNGQVCLSPGFGKDFLGQPYYVIRQAH